MKTFTKIDCQQDEDVFVRKSKLTDKEWLELNSDLLSELKTIFPSDLLQGKIDYSATAITEAYKSVIDKHTTYAPS